MACNKYDDLCLGSFLLHTVVIRSVSVNIICDDVNDHANEDFLCHDDPCYDEPPCQVDPCRDDPYQDDPQYDNPAYQADPFMMTRFMMTRHVGSVRFIMICGLMIIFLAGKGAEV